MSSDLESLSNKELRAKCMEYGLPNVPVTNSSRKLLIRRLAAAMLTDSKSSSSTSLNTSSAKTGSRNQRRETMHVSKPSEKMAPPPPPLSAIKPIIHSESINKDTGKSFENSRVARRTIATTQRNVTTTCTISEPESSDTSPERFSEKTPQQYFYPQSKSIQQLKETSQPETTSSLTSTPNEKKLYPALPMKEPSPKPVQLNKTAVVTTSYIVEKPINEGQNKPYNFEDYVEFDEDDNANENDAQTKNISIINVDDYEDGLNLLAPLENSPKRRNMALPDFTSTVVGNSSLGRGLGIRSSNNVVSVNTSNPKFTNPEIKRLSSATVTIPQNKSGSNLMTRSSYTSTNYIGSRNLYNYEEDINENNKENGAFIEDDKENTGLLHEIRPPYLSEFARKLEHLKASPISCKPSSNLSLAGNDNYTMRNANRAGNFNSYGGTTVSSSLRNREILSDVRSKMFGDYTNSATLSSTSPYGSITSANSMITSRATGSQIKPKSSFQQCMIALNQKYHLKQILFLITLFVIGVFVYVFFIQTI